MDIWGGGGVMGPYFGWAEAKKKQGNSALSYLYEPSTTGFVRVLHSITAKGAQGNVTEELFVLILLLCSLVPVW